MKRVIPCQMGSRIETGPVEIGPDSDGLFIRADEAAALAEAIRGVTRHSNAQRYHMVPVADLQRQLQACAPRTGYRS